MPETENTNPNAALCIALANAGVKYTVTPDGQIFVDESAAQQHAEQPAATKPKAKKTTPTKRKPKANAFYEEVIVGGYAKRQMRQTWAATKGKNMAGVPLDIAQRNGWASKKTGKVTKKGEKAAKPTRTTTWS
tara:strand:+ start:273 stop:671 length:399 start_codon:yes stop_codon:yes gene_type:complete